MAETAQQRATRSYRQRQLDKGLQRLEVAVRPEDKPLIQGIARKLSDDPTSQEVREALNTLLRPPPPSSRGAVLRALRASPLVGSDIDLSRDHSPPREIDL